MISRRRKRKATISQEIKAIKAIKMAETAIGRARTATDKTEARASETNVRSTEAMNGTSVAPTQKTKATINVMVVLSNAEATQAAELILGTRATTCGKIEDLERRKPRNVITTPTQADQATSQAKRTIQYGLEPTISTVG